MYVSLPLRGLNEGTTTPVPMNINPSVLLAYMNNRAGVVKKTYTNKGFFKKIK